MTTGSDPVGEAIADWATRTASDDAPAPVRAVSAGATVELREISEATVRDVCRLQVAPGQRGHVAPNAVSLAEALFEPKAWYRTIVADDVPVGFLMLYDDPDKPEYFLWRLMIGAPYQGLGMGRRAIELLVAHVRTRPAATELRTSWVPGPHGPERFYLALGFEPTGEVDEGEIVARLAL
jgi:diamine N-acetyltransferase